jgi:hypothetical protein
VDQARWLSAGIGKRFRAIDLGLQTKLNRRHLIVVLVAKRVNLSSRLHRSHTRPPSKERRTGLQRETSYPRRIWSFAFAQRKVSLAMRLSADALQARYRVEDTEVHGNVFFRHTGLAARNLTATLARLGLVVETPLLKSRARGVPNLTGRIRKGLMEEPTLAETFPMFCQPQEQRLAIPEI